MEPTIGKILVQQSMINLHQHIYQKMNGGPRIRLMRCSLMVSINSLIMIDVIILILTILRRFSFFQMTLKQIIGIVTSITTIKRWKVMMEMEVVKCQLRNS